MTNDSPPTDGRDEEPMKPLATSCRAAVFTATGEPFELRNLPLPRLRDGDCLVQITCCTVCGSDLHTIAGRRQEATPLILGHEIVGVVRQVAGSVVDLRGTEIRTGDRVVWSICCGCGDCRNCRRGIPQKCESLKKYGHQSIGSDWDLSGGFSEFCHLPYGTAILKIEKELPDQVASPAGCVTATAAAAIRVARPEQGDRVLIFGAGLMGLTATAMLCGDGRQIGVCDPHAERRNLAPSFGAVRAIASADHDLDAKGGERFDIVLEMSGSPVAVEAAVELADIGGRVVLAGSVMPSPRVPFDPELVVRRLVQITGIHNYAPSDLVEAVDFLTKRHHDFPFREVVERSFALAEIDDAVRYCLDRRPLRVAIEPNVDD